MAIIDLLIVTIVIIASVLLVVSVVFGFVYVQSAKWVIDEMVTLSHIKEGEIMADLGSGNGEVLIAFAKKGIQAHGYEINPFLVLWSRFRIWKAGVSGRAHVHLGSFFSADVSKYNVITIFVVPYIMPQIKEKVFKEAKKGTRIIVETFPFPKVTPSQKHHSLYLYKI